MQRHIPIGILIMEGRVPFGPQKRSKWETFMHLFHGCNPIKRLSSSPLGIEIFADAKCQHTQEIFTLEFPSPLA